MLLENKVALITGGANGIGRATALRFAGEGAKVVIADLDEAGLLETQKAITETGGMATTVIGNVSVRPDVENMVDTALSIYGGLHILINNAGILRDGLTSRIKAGEPQFMSDDQWDAVLGVNLKGTWVCSQLAAIPMMKQGYGRIVNTASISALGNIGQANYVASKAGVIGLTKTLALEWARYGIAVNCVAPGAVQTRMAQSIPEKFLTQMVERIPYKRPAEPREIAAAHAWLASNEASYITGQVLFIDGGLSLGF